MSDAGILRTGEHRLGGFCIAVGALWQRELLRFVRQRSRVVGAIGTPLIFWLVIGSGLGGSFDPGGSLTGQNYLEYAFPGTIVLVVMFTAIFSTISLIEDRKAGFLQGVLVAPIGREAIVWGKVLAIATLAVVQGAVLLPGCLLMGIRLGVAAALCSVAVLLLLSVGLASVGVWIAWWMESTQGFHAIMNLLLMPLWLMSGALFPASGASPWIQWLMLFNPLTYGVAALRYALYADAQTTYAAFPSVFTAGLVSVWFAILMLRAALRVVHQR